MYGIWSGSLNKSRVPELAGEEALCGMFVAHGSVELSDVVGLYDGLNGEQDKFTLSLSRRSHRFMEE